MWSLKQNSGCTPLYRTNSLVQPPSCNRQKLLEGHFNKSSKSWGFSRLSAMCTFFSASSRTFVEREHQHVSDHLASVAIDALAVDHQV